MADQRAGLARRLRETETAHGVTTTKSDRVALHKRLAALETAASITPDNPPVGLDNRLDAIEAAE